MYKIRLLVILFSLYICFVSCSKNSPYYSAENKVNNFDGSIIDYINSQNGIYDSLLLVLNRLPALRDTLLSDGSFTVMVPSNNSFTLALKSLNELRTLQKKPSLSLSDLDSANLDTLMCRYIFNGIYKSDTAANLADGINPLSYKYNYKMNIKTITTNANGYVGAGAQIIRFSDVKNSIFERYWVTTSTVSVNIHLRKSKLIHLLSSAHEFGFNEFVTRFN